MKHWTDKLKKTDACGEAIRWAKDFKTFKSAWDNCERADWMMWLAGYLCVSTQKKKQIILASCKCARRALKYIPKEEKRPLKTIQIAEKWAKGVKGITWGDVGDVAQGAYNAYLDTSDEIIEYATHAISAIDAADDDTVYRIALAVYEANGRDEVMQKKELKAMANIVRKNLKIPVL